MDAFDATLMGAGAVCGSCGREVEVGGVYHYQGKMLCEVCCMDVRIRRGRKTHWQYIGSIKSEYLIPSKNPS